MTYFILEKKFVENLLSMFQVDASIFYASDSGDLVRRDHIVESNVQHEFSVSLCISNMDFYAGRFQERSKRIGRIKTKNLGKIVGW